MQVVTRCLQVAWQQGQSSEKCEMHTSQISPSIASCRRVWIRMSRLSFNYCPRQMTSKAGASPRVAKSQCLFCLSEEDVSFGLVKSVARRTKDAKKTVPATGKAVCSARGHEILLEASFGSKHVGLPSGWLHDPRERSSRPGRLGASTPKAQSSSRQLQHDSESGISL